MIDKQVSRLGRVEVGLRAPGVDSLEVSSSLVARELLQRCLYYT
jgi:hypothetical protein